MAKAKKCLGLIILFLLVAGMASITTSPCIAPAFASVLTLAPQTILAGEVQLVWSECEIPQIKAPINLIYQQADECFSQPLPRLTESERKNTTTGVDDDSLHLRIGQDSYRVEKIFEHTYGMYRNKTALATLTGMMGSHSANISLVNINDKPAWEFWGFNSYEPRIDEFTVIYGQDDVRNIYQLDEAFRPYSMNDKLIFIGKQDDIFFVVYDGEKIGVPFDYIHIAHCCEPSYYSVHFGQGRYVFRGIRDGKSYMVEVKPIK